MLIVEKIKNTEKHSKKMTGNVTIQIDLNSSSDSEGVNREVKKQFKKTSQDRNFQIERAQYIGGKYQASREEERANVHGINQLGFGLRQQHWE